MRIEQLEYLVEVSKHKTFAAASESLYITPQFLSRAVATIEQEVGQPLLECHAKGVSLTPAGEIFLDMARKVLQEYYSAPDRLNHEKYIQKVKINLKGDLYLHSYAIFTDTILTNVIIHSFKNIYPDVNIFSLAMQNDISLAQTVNQAGNNHILLTAHAVNKHFTHGEAINDTESDCLHVFNVPIENLAWFFKWTENLISNCERESQLPSVAVSALPRVWVKSR